MSEHLHAEVVAGCYRCELGRDEIKFIDECEHDWMEFGAVGEAWRECFLCGKQEDAE